MQDNGGFDGMWNRIDSILQLTFVIVIIIIIS
jgi:hypothetical protein